MIVTTEGYLCIGESVANICWSATCSGVEIYDDVSILLEEIDLDEGCENSIEDRRVHVVTNGIRKFLGVVGRWIDGYALVGIAFLNGWM